MGNASFVSRSLFVLIALACLLTRPTRAEDEGWISLFNGKDLSGWYTFLEDQGTNKDPDRVFTVEDGAIHIYKHARDSDTVALGFLSTPGEYSHYHLRFQYKWGKKRFGARSKMKRDSGLMYHAVGPDGVLQNAWPRSMECQVQEGDTGDIICIAGARCTVSIDPKIEAVHPRRGQYLAPEKGGVPSTSNSWSTKSGTYDRLEGWNTVDVIVAGSDYAVYMVNGHVNHRLTKIEQESSSGAWVPLASGRILLQAELAEVFFRDIKIKPITTGPFRPGGGIYPDSGGTLTLTAASASVSGPSLRFQPDEHDTLGHWHDRKDKATWKLNVEKAGPYAFELEWSVGETQAGKTFRVNAGDSSFVAMVPRSGGWWTYKRRIFGALDLKTGVVELTIAPATGFKGALMDIRVARLSPLDEGVEIAWGRRAATPQGGATLRAHADGTFKLPAAAAILSGPSLRFQPDENDTLGHWQNAEDRARWSIDVEKPGKYAFELDWAVDDRQAGKTLRVLAGDSSFEADIPGTGGWHTYQKKVFGQLELREGEQQVMIEPSGKFQGALLDVRMALLVPLESSTAPAKQAKLRVREP